VSANFLPGRTFRDDTDFRDQIDAWIRDVADVRVHGTTHERPIDRFVAEAPALIATAGQAAFRHEAPHRRIVAEDYLVCWRSLKTDQPDAVLLTEN